jgi:hypothetical protein
MNGVNRVEVDEFRVYGISLVNGVRLLSFACPVEILLLVCRQLLRKNFPSLLNKRHAGNAFGCEVTPVLEGSVPYCEI